MFDRDKEASMTDYERRPWTFLTNHARVLVAISQNPDIRGRDVARMTGITERSTQRIVAELEEAGYLSHERIGRRNHYQVSATATFRHPLEQDVEIGLLLRLFSKADDFTSADKLHP
jgi:DNA-binding MarR family transcriptional regulator